MPKLAPGELLRVKKRQRTAWPESMMQLDDPLNVCAADESDEALLASFVTDDTDKRNTTAFSVPRKRKATLSATVAAAIEDAAEAEAEAEPSVTDDDDDSLNTLASALERELESDKPLPPPPPLPKRVLEADIEIESTYDADELLNHLRTRLAEYEGRTHELALLDKMLSGAPHEFQRLHAPINAYIEQTAGIARAARCEQALAKLLELFEKNVRIVQVLRRAQSACAIEVKRLCVIVESLLFGQLAVHAVRRMPGSRRDMVRPVFGAVDADAMRALYDAPAPTAINAEHAVTPSVARVVCAEASWRPQSLLPSQRSSLITESTVRKNWSQRDTATAHALYRARAAAAALRERRQHRAVSLPLAAAAVPLLLPNN